MNYSIIIPVYNTEAYLDECLESILAQDSDAAYEVILVDDGSPDHSGVICDEYAARYENFHVIHKQNGGLPSARNTTLNTFVTVEQMLFAATTSSPLRE